MTTNDVPLTRDPELEFAELTAIKALAVVAVVGTGVSLRAGKVLQP